MADQTKLTGQDQDTLRAQLQLLAGQARELVTLLDKPQPLAVVLAFARSLHSGSQAVLALGVTTEQATTYAVNVRHGVATLHDLDSMRAPDSPEGLT